MADKPKRWTPKKNFHPGGQKGKLHRELGVPADQDIGPLRIAQATHSRNPEIRRDAIRAQTMSHWHHAGGKARRSKLYDHPSSHRS